MNENDNVNCYGKKKFFLMCSTHNVSRLNVHAIVHPSNEHLDDRNPISDEIFAQGGPALLKEVREDIRGEFANKK